MGSASSSHLASPKKSTIVTAEVSDPMKDFSGKIAVITGGGTGMGRELARQLVAEGCSLALCDLSEANMGETARLCRSEAAQGAKVTTHLADVSIEEHLNRFRDEVAAQQDTDKIHLLFNNAG